MTVQSVVVGADPDVLKVGLSDGSFFFLRRSLLAPGVPEPRPGESLSDETAEAYRELAEARDAEIAALRLTALREHSRFQLERKLRLRAHSAAAVSRALDLLEGNGLLDDARFCSLWLRSRLSSRPEGRAKLLAGLLSRGVARATAERVLRETVSESDEIETARRYIDRRRSGSENGAALERKLMAAGFSRRVVRAALSDE